MASSLIGGLLGSGASAKSIAVVDPDNSACARAVERFDIHAAADLETALSALSEDQLGIVLAVKPHIIEAVCTAITQSVEKGAFKDGVLPLVISVAAGVRASSMQTWLPENTALVRCMPNTPALLGLGATALFANTNCSTEQKNSAESLLKTAGMAIWVKAEQELDAVTAVSGSGPAYFFYLIEHMASAGTALGLDESIARDLAIETAFGAASMARAKEHSPAVLRENVTSKGGTTAAALAVFNESEVPAIVEKAMQAAKDRASELGDQLAPK